MRKNDDGLCSIQEYNEFRTCIFDAVDEWIKYYDADPEMGIAIEQTKLDVEICKKDDAQGCEWFSLESLAPEGEAEADAVLDLTYKFCFIR